MTNLVDAVMLCNVCIRIKNKGKPMNLFFSFEKYLYLKYIQKYLHLNTFTNECISNRPKEKYLYLNTFQCIWPHTCLRYYYMSSGGSISTVTRCLVGYIFSLPFKDASPTLSYMVNVSI